MSPFAAYVVIPPPPPPDALSSKALLKRAVAATDGGMGGLKRRRRRGKKKTLCSPLLLLFPRTKRAPLSEGERKTEGGEKEEEEDGPSWCPNAPFPLLPLSRRRHLRRQHSFLRHWHGLLLVLRDGSSYKKGAPESTSEIHQLSTTMSKRHQVKCFMMTSEGFQRYRPGESHTTPMEGGLALLLFCLHRATRRTSPAPCARGRGPPPPL